MSALLLRGVKAVGGFLMGLPIHVWVILALCCALYVSNGKYESAAKLAADRLVVIEEMHTAASKTTEKAVEIREVETIKYVDRVKTIREKADVIEKQVYVYLPRGTADFPGGFRMLHDAAATGIPIAEGVSRDDAYPVPAADAASTIASNYADCRVDKEQVMLWQAYYQRLCDTYGCE